MRPWLAIDSATDQASVAVMADGALAERAWRSGRNHTTELTAAVASVLAEARTSSAELQGIAVAIGPGSYTGLRIGLALAKGMALATGAAVVGVPTLHALAAALSPPITERGLPLHAMLRAGRGRIAAAAYPPEAALWPRADEAVAWSLEAWLSVHRPPGWVAGELEPDEVAAVRAVGFRVPPQAAMTRRAAFLVDLAVSASHESPCGLEDLVPSYLGRGPG